MLSFTAAAREANIDLHLQCEGEFLDLAHGFDRIHYIRWNTFQHVYLVDMKQKSKPAYQELKSVGHTASQSGGVFNCVPGDYICERQNAETKGTGSHLKAGFIKNTKIFNRYSRTRHIAVSMQALLNNVLKIKIAPSTHKDSTPSGLRRHADNVGKLKSMIRNDYQYQFFANEQLKAITTGKEVPP